MQCKLNAQSGFDYCHLESHQKQQKQPPEQAAAPEPTPDEASKPGTGLFGDQFAITSIPTPFGDVGVNVKGGVAVLVLMVAAVLFFVFVSDKDKAPSTGAATADGNSVAISGSGNQVATEGSSIGAPQKDVDAIKGDTQEIVRLIRNELRIKNERITSLHNLLGQRVPEEPAPRARELAAQIPDTADAYARALKAIAEQRFDDARRLLGVLGPNRRKYAVQMSLS